MKNGGPAFPLPFLLDESRNDGMGEYVDAEDAGVPCGLTIRDYFAGQALAGLLANCYRRPDGEYANSFHPNTIAHEAYVCADAMLKAREEA